MYNLRVQMSALMEFEGIERGFMERIFIARYGEVALKGKNRPYFERILMENLRARFSDCDKNKLRIEKSDGLIFIYADEEFSEQFILDRVGKVFGIASVSPIIVCDSTLEDISDTASKYMHGLMKDEGIKTFKVESSRVDKAFPLTSPEISKTVGAAILKYCKNLKVDVHNPDCLLNVKLRRDDTYIFRDKYESVGGLPAGTNGRGMVMLSGGIDSPVAAWLMAKRGMKIEGVHFHSYPYTGERAMNKVLDLAEKLTEYTSSMKLHSVNVLPIQEAIAKYCRQEEMIIILRRFMVRIAEIIAKENRAMMLITGENLGQVASQTAESIVVTDSVARLPVMRPLIGLDKVEIMDKAKEIGTYDISIRPYEDCCTVFLPKHPLQNLNLRKLKNPRANWILKNLLKKSCNPMN